MYMLIEIIIFIAVILAALCGLVFILEHLIDKYTNINKNNPKLGMLKYNYDNLNKFEVEMDDILTDIREILKNKHKDYGESNLLKHGALGVTLRMSDKVERLFQLLRNGEHKVKDETLEDTAYDLVGYSIQMIRLVRTENIEPQYQLGVCDKCNQYITPGKIAEEREGK